MYLIVITTYYNVEYYILNNKHFLIDLDECYIT